MDTHLSNFPGENVYSLKKKGVELGEEIGTGRQGKTHLESLLLVRLITHVYIYDVNLECAEIFEKESEQKYDIEIEIAPTVAHAVKHADIVQLCTTTIDPIVFGDWVGPGTHINSVTSYAPTVREVDTVLVLKAKVVADSRVDATRKFQ